MFLYSTPLQAYRYWHGEGHRLFVLQKTLYFQSTSLLKYLPNHVASLENLTLINPPFPIPVG